MIPTDLQPTLENDLVLLRPLRENDFEDLCTVASDPLIWEQHPAKARSTREGFTSFFDEALASKGTLIIAERKTEKIIGSSRYQKPVDPIDAIEIGWTFLARAYWGGHYNKAVKDLMIAHAFTFTKHILFFVNENNLRSQKAVAKIGGQRVHEVDGVKLTLKPGSTVMFRISKM